jgi:hypothetical protein
MPVGNISQAIRLIESGLNIHQSYSYYFATSMPGYQSSGALATVPFSIIQPSNPAHPTPANPGSYTLTASHYVNRTADSESAVAAALSAMDGVSGVSFNYQDDTSAHIVMSFLNISLYDYRTTPIGEIHAWAWYPKNSLGSYASDIWILQGGATDVATIRRSVQHELLHTVGLVDITSSSGTPVFTGDEDTGRYTIMSYKLHPGENRAVTELQLYDIAALQALYGRDETAHAGDTTHNSFSETIGTVVRDRIFSIWDGVGNDTIDALLVPTTS